MKKFKFLLLFVLMMLVTNNGVFAESCDDDDIARLKKIANNVTVTYEYDDESESLGTPNKYYATVSGLTEEIYVRVVDDDRIVDFGYNSENQGVVTNELYSGVLEAVVYSTDCGEELRTIDISLQYFNVFSTYEECDGIDGDDLYVCSRYVDEEITENEFEREIKKYNSSTISSEEIENFLSKYVYIFIIVGIVIVILLFVLIRRRKKKNTLD